MKNVENKDIQSKKNKESGMSLVEAVPIIIVMASLFGFLLGAWGIAHKSILTSIAARTYAFETFNNRANLIYFNDIRSERASYEVTNLRYHAIGTQSPAEFSAPTVPIRYPSRAAVNTGANEIHISTIWENPQYQPYQEIEPNQLANLNSVWVTIGYGICVNHECGGD